MFEHVVNYDLHENGNILGYGNISMSFKAQPKANDFLQDVYSDILKHPGNTGLTVGNIRVVSVFKL